MPPSDIGRLHERIDDLLTAMTTMHLDLAQRVTRLETAIKLGSRWRRAAESIVIAVAAAATTVGAERLFR